MPLNGSAQRSNGANEKFAFLFLSLSNENLPQSALSIPKAEQDNLTLSEHSEAFTLTLYCSA